jgi:hypothetical protein
MRSKAQIVAAAVVIIIALFGLVEARGFVLFGRIMPVTAALTAIVAASVLIIDRLLKDRRERRAGDATTSDARPEGKAMEDAEGGLPPFLQAFLGLYVIGLGSVLLSLHLLGLYLGAVVGLTVLRLLQQQRPSWRVVLIQTLVISVVIYALTAFLGVAIPRGILFS